MSGLRDAATKHGHGHEPGFRWRGREISRLEGLSDAVFAFAITLLVISLEVPHDIHEMVAAMRGFVAFIFSFLVLYRLWVTQYKFFRRYGLEDATTIRLNGVLLFMVLFFVYPLKFLTYAVTQFVVERGVGQLRPHVLRAVILEHDGRVLVLLYFFGSAAVLATLAFMYRHAYRRRHALELTPHEAHRTRAAYQRLFLGAGIATLGPIGLLTIFTRFETIGAIVSYSVVGAFVLVLLRLRRAVRNAPSMDEAYLAPDEVTAPLDS